VFAEELLVLLRSHPTPSSHQFYHPTKFQSPHKKKNTNPNFQRYKESITNNHRDTTQHIKSNLKNSLTHTLCSVLFSSVLFHNMDFWTSSLPLDDEFEKLVIRMNPPR